MKKFKVIMIDAFKPSYLKYAPYLRSLTEKYQHGELEMTHGHWGCIQILFEGKSSILAIFYKDGGKLKYLESFWWLEGFGKFGRFIIDVLFNIPRMIKGYELFRTGNIPISKLSKMDVSINKHFAEKENVDFIYFGELDGLGHKHGSKSVEIMNAVREIDEKISGMDFDLIFSDHGMVNVEKIIGVPITENCFIDSDMARYWGNKEELKIIEGKLPLDDGEILDWPDKRFGDLIFLAKTGRLIYPNFWDKKKVKACMVMMEKIKK